MEIFVMHIESIGSESSYNNSRLLFLAWARVLPKSELSLYPRIAESHIVPSCNVIALVDDILPKIKFGRLSDHQSLITKKYVTDLPNMGFLETHILSQMGFDMRLEDIIDHSRRFTLSEFEKVVPLTKRGQGGDFLMSEILEFVWHLHVINFAINRLNCAGTISGIKTKYFYLATRKIIPNINMYFVGKGS